MKTRKIRSVVTASAMVATLLGSAPAMAGAKTGAAATERLLPVTTAACIASMGPQAVFTGVACATGWAAMGVAWLFPE